MSRSASRIKAHSGRSHAGSQMTEFSAALIILIGFVIVPLLDLTIIPVRWMMAQEIVNDYARKLAFCETFRQSHRTMDADPSLSTRLQRLGGVSVKSLSLHLRIQRIFKYAHPEEYLIVEDPGAIPAAWLPDGAKSPCAYSLEVDVRSLMAPAIMFPERGTAIPGLTAPVPLLVTASHAWENFGRDPATGKFFLNE
jgi:hypothetical protein